MLNIIQNTIGAIRRVGESVVRAGLKMWLPFTKAEPLGKDLIVDGDFPANTTAWSFSGGATLEENGAKISNEASSGSDIAVAIQVFPLTVSQLTGKVFEFTYDVIATNGETLAIQQSSNVLLDTATVGVNRKVTFTWDFGFNDIRIKRHTAGVITNVTIDNVSLKELTQETPDISGNDNNAILKTGKALRFHANDSLQTSFPTSKDIKTIAFWIYPTGSNTNETLFWFGGSSFNAKYVLLNHLTLVSSAYRPTDFDVYVDGVFAGATNGGVSVTLTQDQWQRVVFKSSTAINVTDDTLDVASGAASGGQFIMSDLQVYGAEWTTDDIAYDYANPQKLVTDNASSNVTLNDLHAWWHMSEGDGTIAFDSAPLIGKVINTNSDFTSGSYGWDAASVDLSFSTFNDKLKVIDDGTTPAFSGRFRTVANNLVQLNKTYRISYKIVDSLDVNAFRYYNGVDFVNISSSVGEHEVTYKHLGVQNFFYLYLDANANGYITFDYIRLKEVYNIDGETYDGSSLGATYVDAQERIPQLGMMNWSKGSNLLTYSEDFSEWSNVSSGTGSQVVLTENQLAPDGTLSATKMFFDKGTGSTITDYSILQKSFASQSNTASVYLRADTPQKIMIRNSTTFQLIDVSTDWVRINKTDSGGAFKIGLRSGYVSGEPNTSTIYVWGAQVESGTTASAYRRTNGTAVTDATLISSATDSQKDILGNAVRVKGSGFNLDGTGYGEVLDDASINPTTAITIGCWVYFEGNKNDLGIVGKWEPNKTDYLITQIFDGSNRKLRFYLTTTDSTAIISSPAIVGNKWVYVACTYNKDAGTNNTKIYTIIPGNLDINNNQIIEKATATYTGSIKDSDNEINIGQYNFGLSGRFDNKIDDVKIYNTDLSEAQIEQNFNATKSGHNN